MVMIATAVGLIQVVMLTAGDGGSGAMVMLMKRESAEMAKEMFPDFQSKSVGCVDSSSVCGFCSLQGRVMISK
ncbi:hypothetical protein V8C35DRAFT_297340 [Trichoderma chlorosporum]